MGLYVIYLQTHPLFFYILLCLLGLCVGSFLNVVIYRLPLMLKETWTADCKAFLEEPYKAPKKPIGLVLPRSHCPHCKQLIHAWQNIPIISYLILKGKCAHCEAGISLRYPLIELLSAFLTLLVGIKFGVSVVCLFSLIFVWSLIALSLIDIDTQLLPDNITLPLLWLGLIINTKAIFVPLNQAVLSAAGAYLALWLFIKLFYLVTGKIGMGEGDFKLFAVFGAWFGYPLLPLILLMSSAIGAIVGSIYLKCQKQTLTNTPLPFGPFLCMAAIVCLLYGQEIIDWYLSYI